MREKGLQEAESQSNTNKVLNDSLTYEYFIRRCFGCKRFQNGANTDTWENLKSKEIYANMNFSAPNSQKEFEKKFNEVKSNVDQAFDASLKRLKDNNASETDIENVKNIKTNASLATNTTDLMNSIREANEILKNNNITL